MDHTGLGGPCRDFFNYWLDTLKMVVLSKKLSHEINVPKTDSLDVLERIMAKCFWIPYIPCDNHITQPLTQGR